jgi:WD40 repeat protein
MRWHGRLVYSPDGKILAMGYGDYAWGAGKVRVWEAATGKELHNLGGQLGQKMPNSICFSPDGRSLFAGGHDRPIFCWDLAGGGTPRRIGDFSSAPFVALSRDGKTVTAGCTDANDRRKWTFARWDLASGKEIGRHVLTTAPHWSGSLSPDGGIFARPEEDGKSITLFDPVTGREIARARGCDYPAAIDFSADGAVLTCRSKDGTVRIWDTATGQVRARFKALSTSIDRIVLSSDGKRVALTGRADDAIHVWSVAAGRELHSFVGHRAGPLTIAFLKDGKEIVTVSRDGGHSTPIVTEWADWSFRRWDAATGAQMAVTSSNPKGEVYHTVFSADGRRLAMVIHDGTLRLWDVEAGKELRNWQTPTSVQTTIWDDRKSDRKVIKRPFPAIGAPVFSPDGKTLLAVHGPKILRWEVATGRELPALEVEATAEGEPWCVLSRWRLPCRRRCWGVRQRSLAGDLMGSGDWSSCRSPPG